MRLRFSFLFLLLLAGCNRAPHTGLDFPDQFPDKLSAWRIVERKADALVLNTGVVAYDLNSPLFSDYAHKLRTVLVPRGTAIRFGDDDFDFPVGTVITKTFYYPRGDRTGESHSSDVIAVRKVLQQLQTQTLQLRDVRLLETRLLINTAKGWVALPYVWNEAQTEATLELTGAVLSMELVTDSGRTPFAYLVPDTNQCADCHAVDSHQQAIRPIGVRARHLNKDYQYAGTRENQLEHWSKTGLLTGAGAPASAPRNAQWDVASSGDLASRARAYLDVNCGHCHNAHGAANTSGLLLNAGESDPVRLGLCKIPIATGRGSGTALLDIVPGRPEESILLHRMQSTEADVAMPELGRSLVHEEGVALIREWIGFLSGDCHGDQA
jgi:uncharacterized repeat protein (TIGR03806 family)